MSQWIYDNFVYVSLAFYFMMMGVEWAASLGGGRDSYVLKDTWVNLSTGLFSMYLPAILGFFILSGLHKALQPYVLFHIDSLWKDFIFAGNFALMPFLVLFFLDDFCYYWYHRFSHIVRVLWCIHEVHHSSEEYNLSVFFRASFFEYTLQMFFWIPVILLGFSLEDIAFQMSVGLVYQFLLHTKYTMKLAFFEFFFNTPSHHRVHHSLNIAYLDRNFGAVLIIWDRIFGTFVAEAAPLSYGVSEPIGTFNPIKVCTKPFVALFKDVCQAPRWQYKLLYVFAPPGWAWNGSGKTTKEVQRAYFSTSPQL